jgi:adenylate cyclase
LRARTAYRLRITIGVTIAAGAVGGVFGLPFGVTPGGAFDGIATGALDGFILVVLEQVLRGHATATLRRLPMLAVLGLRTMLYCAVFAISTLAAAALVRAALPRAPSAGIGVLSGSNMAVFVGASLAFNFAFMLRGLLGGSTLIALLTGRYHRPRQEERIVLFADLRGSTGLAERLGDAGFLDFLNRLVFDLTDAVFEAGGEIYRYIGDEVIVTWRRADERSALAALLCVLAIEDALGRRRGDYLAAFGAAPQLRAALHAGPVIVGEIGDFKREIAILGDTMNTAARIEETCRTSGRDFIASAAVVRRLPALPPGVEAERLGAVPLRGKQETLDLFAISRGGG